MIKELADDLGPRHGMNRRQFLASSAGMAAAFLAMNEVFGPVFDVSPAEAQTPGVANQRADFVHKLSTKLIKTHQAVCIEDLCVRGLARTKLAKVRRVALDRIPSRTRRKSKESSWVPALTWSRKAKGTIACAPASQIRKVAVGRGLRDPRGMVRATLPKPQSPGGVTASPIGKAPEADDVTYPPRLLAGEGNLRETNDDRCRSFKGTNGAPATTLARTIKTHHGKPTGREP